MTNWYVGSDLVVAGTAVAMANGDSLYVRAGVAAGSSASADGISTAGDATANILGDVLSVGGIAFHGSSGGNFITIGETGSVMGGYGMLLAGPDNVVINHGTIAGSTGLTMGVISGGDSTLVNTGNISGTDDVGFHAVGGNITVTNSGTISSAYAPAVIVALLTLADAGNTITNTGTIIAGFESEAIIVTKGTYINNSGQIFGEVRAEGGGNAIFNSGAISCATGSGINLVTLSGSETPNTVDNSGTIIADAGTAIETGDTLLTVTNSGHIVGDIVFGNANDTYDGEAGSIVGLVDGGAGRDTLTGGGMRDRLMGGLGADTLEGNGGRDKFVYTGVAESGSTLHDTVLGFDARKDFFDLDVDVTGIDATVASGLLRSDHFGSDLADAVGALQLAKHHAVLFTPTTGSLAGHTILIVEANGKTGFQTGDKDYAFDLTDADNLGSLDTGDFI